MNNLFLIDSLKKIIKTVPVIKIQTHNSDVSLLIKPNYLFPILYFFKNNTNYQFKILTCISGIDYPSNNNRFSVVYELLSVRFNQRIKIKVNTHELFPLESIGKIFPAAYWYESEIWDMFGIFFRNHANLIRLLTDYGFEGYPLRKDFPLSGYVEVSYDYTRKRVANERLELSQEFRSFKFQSPWENLHV